MFLGYLFPESIFGAKKGRRKGAGMSHFDTPAAAPARFSLLRWVARMTTFGLHFGVVLGTKFATIPLFGRPGAQKGTKKAMKKEG